MEHKSSKILLFTLLTTAFIYSGCGGGVGQAGVESAAKTIKSQTAISTYINKGNFVKVASFAYKKVTDPDFAQSSMDVKLPGSEKGEVVKSLPYDISTIESDDGLKKIIVQNHLNRLVIKLLEDKKVNITFQGTNFTVDRKMMLADFVTVE